MSSGGGVSKMLSAAPAEKSYDFWHAVMAKAGCDNLAAFRALPVDKLFTAWQETKKEVKGGGCFPCLDGQFVVGSGVERLSAGKQKQISYMAGVTSEDMMPPILFKMAKGWCEAQSKPSYAWFFDRQLPGDNCGAWHSSDLWYWFGTLENCWRPMEDKDYALSNQMAEYLCNFAKTGDPNGAGLPAWKSIGGGEKRALRLGEGDTRMGNPNMLKLVYTMLTNKAVGE